MSYKPIYSPKYYLKFLNWLNRNTDYEISSHTSELGRNVYLEISMPLKTLIIGSSFEYCLDQAISILEKGGYPSIVIIATELDVNDDSSSQT